MKNKILFAVGLAVIVAVGLLIKGNFKLANIGSILDNESQKLNVIVVDICSLRADRMHLYGYGKNTTPNLDAFGKDAVVFDNFWTQAGWCLPNFGTLLTGQRPEKHGLDNDYADQLKTLPENVKTLGEIYRKAGYKTAAFSGAKFLSPKYDIDRGFDTFLNKYNKDKEHPASLEANLPEINQFIQSQKSDKPFFLYLTVDDIHSPYMAEDGFETDADFQDAVANYENILPQWMELGVAFNRYYNGSVDTEFYRIVPEMDKIYKTTVAKFKANASSLPYLNARYDSAVKRADGLIGALLNQIRDAGLYDSSVVVITAHQGELLGEHDLLGHIQGLYEPILRTPLVVRMPGVSSGRRPQLTERIDIPATLLDVSGLLSQNKEQFAGASFLSMLRDSQTPADKYIFASSRPNNRTLIDGWEYAVRDSQYKLTYYTYKEDKPYELYDLKNDSSELNDIFSAQSKKAQELKIQLENYMRENKR